MNEFEGKLSLKKSGYSNYRMMNIKISLTIQLTFQFHNTTTIVAIVALKSKGTGFWTFMRWLHVFHTSGKIQPPGSKRDCI